MFSKNTNIALLLSILFCVSTFGALAAFFYVGELHKATFLEKSTQEIREKAQKSALEQITTTLDETKEERISLFSRFPHEEDIVDVLTSIEKIVAEQGVKITTNSLSLTVRPIDETFETLVITLNMEGSHDAIVYVLKLFETMPYQVTVTNVHLERVGEGGTATWRSTGEIRITKFKKV